MALEVIPQPTPNPNAMKFNVSRIVVETGSKSYDSREEAREHPLALRLLSLQGVTSVFILKDFITLSKAAEADWENIIPGAVEVIREELS